MARDKSAVLTPKDKKAVITDLKNQIKSLTASIKAKNGELAKAVKAHQAFTKAIDKEVAGFTKQLDKLNSELSAIQAG